MDAATITDLSAEIQPAGVIEALKAAIPTNKDWFQHLDACVFSYLLRLLQGQTAKESYLEPVFVRDTIAAYLQEFDLKSTEEAAKQAADSVITAMDSMGLSKPPVKDTTNKLAIPLTMGRQYEETLRKAGGNKVSVEKYNESWTWETKANQAKEQRRKRKEDEKKAILTTEYEQFLKDRGLAQEAHKIIRIHDKGDTMSAGARASVEIRCHSVTIQMGKNLLIDNSEFVLLPGHRYGLAGRNGTGKTTLLRALAEGDLEGVSPFVQVVHVEQELGGDTMTAIESILSTDVERTNLMKEEKELLKNNDDASSARLAEIYTRLDEIDAHSAESKASAILSGLSFTHEMMHLPTNRLSGGWRMRVALARALFVEPDILLLDEPTNHLDLHAVLWLEQFLLRWTKTLVVVSHSRSFLNSVCTEMIHLTNKKLDYYTGNYDKFEETRHERLKNQQREYETQQAQRAHMQAFVDKFRASAARAKMAQSRMKALDRMELIGPVDVDQATSFVFKQPDEASGPLVQICDCTFGYKAGSVLFSDVNFSLDSSSRVALVGANGAGKSTFLKVLLGELEPKSGVVVKNPKIRIGYFSQHHLDQLIPQNTSLEFMRLKFPDMEEGQLRGQLSSFGLSGDQQLQPIYTLSGGQKSRVAFAWLTMLRPHLLFLDEPTNHLDIDTVTALLQALMTYNGGLLVVSHDESFIGPLCDEIYVCGGGAMKKYNGEFDQYRKEIAKTIKI